jgi:hypothetical protein
MSTVTFNYAEHDKQLRQLFELAEDNQLAVQDAIACLSAEREAFTNERIALMKSAVNSAEVSDTLRRSTAQAIPAIEAAAEKAIQTSMERVLGLSRDAASQALGNATTPVIERFTDVVKTAGYRYAWQWSALAALGVLATVVVAVVGVQQLKAQQAQVQHQQEELQAQRTAFSEEMARMQASVTFLEKKGGRIHLSRCGPEQRLCIEVTPDQGNGRNNFRGVWSDASHERSFVIPKGY